MARQKIQVRAGHCPSCGPDKKATIVGEHKAPWESDDSQVSGNTDYRILECRGCDRVYFETCSTCSEDEDYRENPYTGETERYFIETKTYWPAPAKRSSPSWSHQLYAHDADLGALFDETFSALNSGLLVLTAIGIRTTFDRASEVLGVDAGLSFDKKLAELSKLGKISTDESKILEVLVEAGNAAAHRGWRPTEKDIEAMMSTVEAFLHRTIILGNTLTKIQKRIPPRQKPQK